MGTIELPKPIVESAQPNGRFGWITQNLGSHAREYGGTFATEFTVLASQLLVYKLAALFLGKTGFSEYAVARRTISLIYPLPLLGIAVALPRYVAHAVGAGNGVRTAKYFGAAVWCMGLGLLVSVVLMNAFPGMFAVVFFAGRQYANLVLPLSLLLIGLVLHTLVYSYFRGCLKMRRANLLQFVNFGMVPLAAFLISSGSVQSVLLALGILTTLVACAALAFTPLRHAGVHVIPEAKELLRYGVQRVPGDFALMALFTLPATFVAHLRGVQEAGYVAFGISVLNMVGAMFTPLGLILLPKAGKMFASGSHDELREHVWTLAKLTMICSSVMAVGLSLFAHPLIRFYLGSNFEEVASIVRIILLGGVPYCLYLVLRNVVDAFHEMPMTTLILGVALLAFIVGAALAHALFPTAIGIVTALLIALVAVGGLISKQALKVLGT
jgi:O-antigen/teichoic acid export membrane protein